MDYRVTIMHGFENADIDRVMKAVREALGRPKDLIFAKSTPHSLTMRLGELIQDMSEDHEYLKNNPPDISGGATKTQPDAT